MKVEHRYFLQHGDGPEREVTLAEWVQAERGSGFRPRGEDRGQPATGGFIASNGLRGRIKTDIIE